MPPLPLWLLSASGWLRSAAGGALRWLFADLRNLLVVALAVLAFVVWQQRDAARHDATDWQAAADKWREATGAWQDAHADLIARVEAERAAAAAADRANAARVERQYQLIAERTADDYETRLADTGAALERLRDDLERARTAAPGGGGGREPDLSGDLAARCRAFGAADCDALLAALPDQLAAAETNTATLIALQDWARSVLAVDIGNEVAAAEVAGD